MVNTESPLFISTVVISTCPVFSESSVPVDSLPEPKKSNYAGKSV